MSANRRTHVRAQMRAQKEHIYESTRELKGAHIYGRTGEHTGGHTYEST